MSLPQFHKKIRKIFHTLGLNRPKILRKLHDEILKKQIDFPLTVQGVKMPHVLLKIYFAETHESETTELFKKVVKEGDTIVDLGSHFGYYSLIGSKLVGKNGKVFAFEPFHESLQQLRDGIKANKFTNIIPVQKAVSNTSGEKKFYLSSISNGRNTFNEKIPHDSFIPIPSVTLDDYFGDTKIDFIKMDIEGEELNALEGAKYVIAHNPGIKMTIELSPKTIRSMGMEPKDFLSKIRSYGLKTKLIKSDGAVEEVSDERLIQEAKRGHINVFCERA